MLLEFADLWVSLNKFKPAWMGLPRLVVAFMVFPLFAGTIMTGLVRNGILLSLVFILYPMLDASFPKVDLTWLQWMGLIIKEIFIGMVIAYLISIPFWVVESVGHVIDFQTGASNSVVFDPLSGKESGINAQFLLQLTGAAFFATGFAGFLTAALAGFAGFLGAAFFTTLLAAGFFAAGLAGFLGAAFLGAGFFFTAMV